MGASHSPPAQGPVPVLKIPDDALVVLVGAAGSGKTTFARRHFRPTAVLSSDAFRAMLADDENDQAVSREAFELLHLVAARRLRAGRLTVIDATNVQRQARRVLLGIAATFRRPAVAIVLDIPEEVCQQRNLMRPHRSVDPAVIRRQLDELRRSLETPGGLDGEGFAAVQVFRSADALDAARVELERRPRRAEAGLPAPERS